MVESQECIAICGAGVAGLTLAVRLRELGFNPSVFEARSEEAVVTEGEFFTLAPNGMNALRAIGCYDKVAATGIDTRAIEFLNGRGRKLAIADQSDHERVFGAPSMTLRRNDLTRILLNRARELKIPIHFGHKVSQLEFSQNAVSLTFADGCGHHAAIVVGADGLRSSVRTLAFPEFPDPNYTGLTGCGGVVEADISPTGGAMRMVFGAQSFFGYLKEPSGPVFWFNSYQADTSDDDGASPSERALKIRRVHAADPNPVATILAQVQELERTYPIFDMPPLPKWFAHRVVLIGDAAHAVGPHAGQGASMAIEDALVLAGCMANEKDITAAFARYEASRRPRIADVARLTTRNKSSKEASGPFALIVRDLVLPLVLPLGIRAGRKLYAYRPDLDPLVVVRDRRSSSFFLQAAQ